jgi:hypothetical protein
MSRIEAANSQWIPIVTAQRTVVTETQQNCHSSWWNRHRVHCHSIIISHNATANVRNRWSSTRRNKYVVEVGHPWLQHVQRKQWPILGYKQWCGQKSIWLQFEKINMCGKSLNRRTLLRWLQYPSRNQSSTIWKFLGWCGIWIRRCSLLWATSLFQLWSDS